PEVTNTPTYTQFLDEVYAARSPGGGEQWETPPRLLDGPLASPPAIVTGTGSVADPLVPGRAYTLWNRLDLGILGAGTAGVFLSETSDGGQSWCPPILVIPNPPAGDENHAGSVALPDGLLVFYIDAPNAGTGLYNLMARRGIRSSDGSCGSWT